MINVYYLHSNKLDKVNKCHNWSSLKPSLKTVPARPKTRPGEEDVKSRRR